MSREEYKITEEETAFEAFGMKVELPKVRWITAEELVRKRRPEVNWGRISGIRAKYGMTVDGGQVKAYAYPMSQEGRDEIAEAEPYILMIHEAEKEIDEAMLEEGGR